MNIFKKIEETIRNILPHNEGTELNISEPVAEIMKIIGDVFIPVSAPLTWLCTDIIRTEHSYELYWISTSESAYCSHCGQISFHKSHTYHTRTIQDLPIQNRSVFNHVRSQRFNCQNQECERKNFFEQYEGVVDMAGRKTTVLQEHICRMGVESSAEGATRGLLAQGIKISGDTVLRLTQKRGLAAMKQQLNQDHVVTLGCDDINRRKGNSSTACTVFIDADTHRFLTIVTGKTGIVVKDFLDTHPSVQTMTRDRATAYASAANKAGIAQVADRFHLFDNLHEAIRKEIYKELPLKVTLGEIRSEESLSTASLAERSLTLECGNTIDSKVESEADQLQKLTKGQRKRFAIVKKIHSMKESEMSVQEIGQQESLSDAKVKYYLRIELEGLLNKKSGKKASSESIAVPYKETIMRMLSEGKKHRKIFKALQMEGFSGSRNCIYQYLKKYTQENGISYGRFNKPICENPEVSRKVVYDKLIRYTSRLLKEDTIAEDSLSSTEDKIIAEGLSTLSALPNDLLDTEDLGKKKSPFPMNYINK